jgi:hypothetical protein
VLISEPKYDYIYTLLVAAAIDGVLELPCQYFVRTSSSNVIGSTQGSHIGYREVTVSRPNNGESTSQFTSPLDFPDIITGGYPFPLGTSYDHLRGRTSENTDYAINGLSTNVVKASANTYTVSQNNHKSVNAIKVGYLTKSLQQGFSVFSVQQYQHISDWSFLSESTETIYPSAGSDPPFVTTEAFKYDNPLHMQLTSHVKSTSDGDSVSVENSYPADYVSTTNSVIQKMSGVKFMHNSIIESIQKRKKNNLWYVTGGTFTRFDEIVNGTQSVILPAEISTLQISGAIPEASFVKSKTSDGVPDSRYLTEQTFSYHPQKYYLVEQKKRNNFSTSYLWSYNSTLPIGEFNNATYLELTNALATTSFNETTILSSIYSDSDIRSMIHSIKTALPNARVSTYTFAPLIGITSVTDSNDRSLYYFYDGFGRLNYTKDNDGKILNKYTYHYKK